MRPFLLTLALVLALAPAAASADDRVVDRLSFGPDGGNGVVDAAFQGMSRDGNCVAFSTREQIVASIPGAQGAVYESCGASFLSLLGNGDVVALNDTGTCALFASGTKICGGNPPRTVAAGRPVALSGNGACAIVVSGTSILRDCDGAAVETVASDATYGGTSADGNCVAYATTTAGAGDLDSSRDVYRRCGGDAPQQMSVTVNHLPEVPDTPATETTPEVPGKPVRDPEIPADAVGISPDGACVVFTTSEALTSDDPDDADRGTSYPNLWKRCGNGAPAVELPITSVTSVNAVANGGCFAYTAGSALSSTCPANRGVIANGGTFAGQADDGSSIAWTSVDGAHQLRGGENVLVSSLRSGGGPTMPAFPGAVSANGETVAFVTQSQLVKDDKELQRDVYKLHPGAVLFPDTPEPAPETPPAAGGGGGGGGGVAFGGGGAARPAFTVTGLVPPGTLTQTNRSAADRQAPRLFGLALEPATLRLRQTGTLRFALSEPATVTVTVERRRDGRLRGKRCVTTGRYARGKGSRKARKAKRCVRWVRTGRPVSGDADDGLTRLSFRPNALVPGRYRIVAGARDGAGNATPKPRTAGFRVRR